MATVLVDATFSFNVRRGTWSAVDSQCEPNQGRADGPRQFLVSNSSQGNRPTTRARQLRV